MYVRDELSSISNPTYIINMKTSKVDGWRCHGVLRTIAVPPEVEFSSVYRLEWSTADQEDKSTHPNFGEVSIVTVVMEIVHCLPASDPVEPVAHLMVNSETK